MSFAFYLAVGLASISPVLLFFDGAITCGVVTVLVSVALTSVSLTIRPGEAEYLAKVTRPLLWLAAIPLAMILVQLLPIPPLEHPIWASAQDALGKRIIGSVTLDRGATLVVLIRYCTIIGLAFVVAAVTVDRARAEVALTVMCCVSLIAALLFVGAKLGTAAWIGLREQHIVDAAGALAALGIVLNTAAVDRAFERYETRRATDGSFGRLVRSATLWLLGLSFCAIVVFVCASSEVAFAAAAGFISFGMIVAARRLGLRILEASAMVGLGLIIAGTIILTHGTPTPELTLRFASDPAGVATALRILSDAGWAGNGAGSLHALVPIYAAIDTRALSVPTAAIMAIEMGRPAFWVNVVLSAGLFVLLLRGALKRGRDSFFPAAATAGVLLLFFEAFCDASVLNFAVDIVAATGIGLAIAQSESRTAQVRKQL